ncbi:hypothetical protein U5U50_02285 [Mycoplasma sp. 888]|uniref:hypothetical protein n=1 Tax=Mycoplasma sp. 888 TaxID=3108483 RepID=UPI002D765DA2|nr:hypothetical protein [Mycoplasma sp. 888]WRQ25614.1 hypothetical protein U5U50_02285 [Mycoplasma sp. 888]
MKFKKWALLSLSPIVALPTIAAVSCNKIESKEDEDKYVSKQRVNRRKELSQIELNRIETVYLPLLEKLEVSEEYHNLSVLIQRGNYYALLKELTQNTIKELSKDKITQEEYEKLDQEWYEFEEEQKENGNNGELLRDLYNNKSIIIKRQYQDQKDEIEKTLERFLL